MKFRFKTFENEHLLRQKNQFCKGQKNDSYNIKKLMWKNLKDKYLLNAFQKHSYPNINGV